MRSDETAFNSHDASNDHGVVNLSSSKVHYEWENKYKPRKPRFFNRVKTGFEWNKYNRAHYDSDIPPPKMVQGYRFNIFYPDLVEKTKAPKYFIEELPPEKNADGTDNWENYTPNTCQIRFSAGPPYEDIAFKIVNREWNSETRQGFRCVFDKGVLQLYFNFQRWQYRR